MIGGKIVHFFEKMPSLMALVVLCTTLCGVVAAQPAQYTNDKLYRAAVDTIQSSDGGYVVTFSDNTWNYYNPQLESIENMDIYKENWSTSSLFAYPNVSLSDLPEVLEIKLVDNLGEFAVPFKGRVISKYGPRRGRNHNGIDVPLDRGEPILSAFDGKVRFARWNSGGFGYLIIIRHTNGLESYSAHLSRLNVKAGDIVRAGQIIGYGGNTGRSSGPHLHYELRYKDHAFDPERIIDFESGTIRYTNFALEKSFFNIRSRASETLDEDDVEIATASELLATADDIARGVQEEAVRQAATYHTIKSGDVLSRIAERYGVTVSKICELNGITRTTTLKLGRKLRIK